MQQMQRTDFHFRPFLAATTSAFSITLIACTPEFNWRELHAGAGNEPQALTLQLPCKPGKAERKLKLGDEANNSAVEVNYLLMACHVGDANFALGRADVGNKEKAIDLMEWLANKLARNIDAKLPAAQNAAVKGLNGTEDAARRYTLQGKLPDGNEVIEHVLLIKRGTQLFQATVTLPAKTTQKERLAAVEAFFSSLVFSKT